jgi:hypothetical protein
MSSGGSWSDRFSQVSGDLTSASNEPGCGSSGSANPTSSAEGSSESTGQTCPATPMFGQLTFDGSKPKSSAEVSRVRTSVQLAVVPGLQASNQDYGRTSPKPFATYDRDSSLWRTFQDSLFEESTPFSQTWPMSGMTRSGIAYRRRPLARPIYEHESFFWPTPVADDTGHRRRPFAQGGVSLSHVVGGPTNPSWIEWLMGFPMEWSDVRQSVTLSSLVSLSGSDDAL